MKIAKLEQNEIHSALWKKLKAHMEVELNTLRMRNDGDHDPVATANIRGQIARLKALLSLEKPVAAQVTDDGR